ncbi:unnamed protein product [Cylindrotheca closterium]|uniref:RING-type domain-containing protein n=1 Tax=Cylindrotheca closterium TaxID=2856 RepID=A0AAD2JNG8_9STRA|nr:unnamed protein product [Cylindrotheca closterium]
MKTTIQHIECPICYDCTNNTVTLPCCKKSFCIPCLEGWKPDVDDYVHGNRTCPNCRALVPPTTEVLQTIQFYKKVSLSLSILLVQDPSLDLPVAPLPTSPIRYPGDQVAIRRNYESIQTTYAQRVQLFEQKYGCNILPVSVIPSSPTKPIHLPDSVIQAVNASNYSHVSTFLGPPPISPQRLEAICPQSGNTLLHITVQANNLDIANVLVALGADVNAANFDRLTSLFYAVKIEGQDDRIAKALIRAGAKKLSMVFPNSPIFSLPDYHLAATAQGLGKVELARMLEKEALGRHCKVQVDGSTKRGTIMEEGISGNSQILLDNTKEMVLVPTSNIEIHKPLLFDFRDIDRNALFPNPPPRNNAPVFRSGTEAHEGLVRLFYFIGGDPETTSRRNGREGNHAPTRTLHNFLTDETAGWAPEEVDDIADAIFTMMSHRILNGNLFPQG